MDSVIDFFKQPFAWGLSLGLLFFCLSAWSHFKTKRELRRYKKMLSDKLELEARQYEVIRKEKESVAKENEHLRVRVQQLMEKPDQKIARDLETLTRAEKRMVLQAPGFAPAWESAKAQAAEELAAEDAGKSLPKRLFNRLFGNSNARELEGRILSETSTTGGTIVENAPSTTVPHATETTPPADSKPAGA
jgi:hypothetical protein